METKKSVAAIRVLGEVGTIAYILAGSVRKEELHKFFMYE